MKIFTVLSFSLCMLFMVGMNSCGKKVEKGNTDYIGFWQGSDGTKTYVIDIDSNSEGRHSECEGALNCSEWEGKARLKNDQLKIGIKKLDIDQEPQETAGIWTMQIGGILYQKSN
jgi:hypothetical protein